MPHKHWLSDLEVECEGRHFVTLNLCVRPWSLGQDMSITCDPVLWWPDDGASIVSAEEPQDRCIEA
jgi:hypothetical protein